MRNFLGLTMGDTLEDNALRFASEPAYVMGDRQITHAALLGRAKRIASAFEKAGLKRQDRISILSMNSLEYAELLAAGQWSGIVVGTVNFRLAPPEMLAIITDSVPRVLVFDAQYLPVVESFRPQLKNVETFLCIGGETEWAQDLEAFIATGDELGSSYRAIEADICNLVYTGGTTGLPKGCILGQRELRAGAERLSIEMRAGSKDRILLVMPLFHVGAMSMAHGIHFRGGCVVLHRMFDPTETLRAVEHDGVTVLHMAPTLVQMVLDHPDVSKTNWSSVNTLVYSAAAMPLPLLERGIAVLGNIFVNLYGLTEVSCSGLQRELHLPFGTDRERKWLTSVGYPFPNTLIKIVGDDGQPCPTGMPGEIVVKSVAMARGYWNNGAATADTFRDGWCYTGDVGMFDEDGLLYLVDRKKDVIISGGENIYSREVEDAVLRHPSVAECAVIGVPDEKWGEAVCAVTVLRHGTTATAEEIIEHCRTLIASYKKPRYVVFVADLPKLATGKINKVELRKNVIE